MKITGNEPAFNAIYQPSHTDQDKWQGLTIRQELAARNMASLMGNPEIFNHVNFDINKAAEVSVNAADALMTELNKDA